MKVYPQDIEEKLGFDQIRKYLIQFCQSLRGAQLAQKAKPTEKYEVLVKWLAQAKENDSVKGKL